MDGGAGGCWFTVALWVSDSSKWPNHLGRCKSGPMILLYIITESCGFPHSQHFCAQNEKRIRGQLMRSTTYNLPHVHLASVLQVCGASGHR